MLWAQRPASASKNRPSGRRRRIFMPLKSAGDSFPCGTSHPSGVPVLPPAKLMALCSRRTRSSACGHCHAIIQAFIWRALKPKGTAEPSAKAMGSCRRSSKARCAHLHGALLHAVHHAEGRHQLATSMHEISNLPPDMALTALEKHIRRRHRWCPATWGSWRPDASEWQPGRGRRAQQFAASTPAMPACFDD